MVASMDVRRTLPCLIFLVGLHVSSAVSQRDFRSFVRRVATAYHTDWRQHFLVQRPFARNRFKLTTSVTYYNSSDFIYPMILSVGSCLVHRNLRVARDRFNGSLIYIDILNMEYHQLPSDWAKENRETARVACRQILAHLRRGQSFDDRTIEKISESVHDAWMQRNGHRTAMQLMVPYEHLSEDEKGKDRRAVLLACRLFNQLRLDVTFKTSPIRFNELRRE